MHEKLIIEKIILSICIPTRNQPQALRCTLDSILFQIERSDVEIVVCDDSDDEESRLVIDSYNHKAIRYFKGKKEGFDEAIIFLTKKARGDYLLWFGDDLMREGMIAKIEELISLYPDISFIWINSCDQSNPNITAFNTENDKFFSDRNEILRTDIGLLAFASSTVIKRENVSDILFEASRYKGLSLMSFFLVLGAISAGGRYYLIGYPYVVSKPKPPGEVRWYDSFEVHAINCYIIAQKFRDKFDHKSFRKGMSDQFGRIWRAVIVERALGLKTGFANYSPKIWKMTRLYWSYPEFWIALPLFLVPRPLLRVLYKAYKFIRR